MFSSSSTANAAAPSILTMVNSDRMAGPIAVWAPQGSIAASRIDQKATAGAIAATPAAEPFGFHDLLNIVNPLQHIPGVSQIYRALTGDTINPASQVLGDTLYGGVLGAAVSMVNEVATNATGHDLIDNAVALAEGKPVGLTKTAETAAASAKTGDDATMLRFTDLGNGERRVMERISADSDRMAGTMIRYRTEDTAAAQPAATPDIVVPVGRSPNSAVPSRT